MRCSGAAAEQAGTGVCQTGAPSDRPRGWWRLVEMDLWDEEDVDLVAPGFIEFDPDHRGSLGFIESKADSIGERHLATDGPVSNSRGRVSTSPIPLPVVVGPCWRTTDRCAATFTSTSETIRASAAGEKGELDRPGPIESGRYPLLTRIVSGARARRTTQAASSAASNWDSNEGSTIRHDRRRSSRVLPSPRRRPRHHRDNTATAVASVGAETEALASIRSRLTTPRE